MAGEQAPRDARCIPQYCPIDILTYWLIRYLSNLLVGKNLVRDTSRASTGPRSDAATRGDLRCENTPSRSSTRLLTNSRVQRRGPPAGAVEPTLAWVPPIMRRQVFGVTCWWAIADANLPDHRLSNPECCSWERPAEFLAPPTMIQPVKGGLSVDGKQFDVGDLVQVEQPMPRRRLLGGLAGGAFTGVLAARSFSPAAAQVSTPKIESAPSILQ